MINRKKQLKMKSNSYSAETEELLRELDKIKSETKLGETLIKLSRKNLETEVTALDADEIMNNLGRLKSKN